MHSVSRDQDGCGAKIVDYALSKATVLLQATVLLSFFKQTDCLLPSKVPALCRRHSIQRVVLD
ncbi:MAG TPA: hypothetical protein VKB96_01140, partial [Gammaproteobacteria bacterium]|nr:hypothetical protein [Gammaproteobacteria bacterium]